MNIFALDPSPKIAAQMHCDKHIHKMILESAQMLCIWAERDLKHLLPYLYQTNKAHAKHPATLWIMSDRANAAWTVALCVELESIRLDLGCQPHSSMDKILMIADNLPAIHEPVQEFVFCGPPQIKYRYDLNVHERYKLYYRQKAIEWAKGLDKHSPMRYKGRSVPDFLADIVQPT